ncbi:nuclear transport factor 2 family protein [Tsukamurella sp. 8F]|uniref:nuclear transport factor 2 family protein n=1 Tax=unclassified Tsukamurella TaxID=2633480 RepID=UPI0023B9C213|nr:MULTISPECIES: nuclear transport factor 2 family protein [unclassified Tsukamurella]MDF0531670.1 nuclear transport factor 2 family protein [Tsukamurella sp. 8J]MDF0588916.1 nuclear transport factor 2 family protein [Tsukamurella sp. 8F]
MTQQQSTLDTLRAYHQNWTTGKIDEALEYVADDIVCKAPGGDLVGKDQYRAILTQFQSTMTGVTDVAFYANDHEAAAFYIPATTATSTSTVAEHFTFRDGKIAENLLTFDQLAFMPPKE